MSRQYPSEIVVYDPEAGKYAVSRDPICHARWATANFDHQQGEICAREATYSAGDVDLCAHHYKRLIDAVRRDAIGRHKKTQIEIDQAIAETSRREAEATRLEAERRGIVYYLYRPSDHMIKIGTTTKWRSRFAQHRREHGELVLLFAHAGGREKEREMHLKFQALRVGAGEWFLPGKPLLNWIRDQRRYASGRKSNLPAQLPITEMRALLRSIEKSPLPTVPDKPPTARPTAPLVPPIVRSYPVQVSEGCVWCTSTDAAGYLGLTLKELAAWRDSGDGPSRIQWGETMRSVRYKVSELPAWAAEHAAAKPQETMPA